MMEDYYTPQVEAAFSQCELSAYSGPFCMAADTVKM